AFIRFHARVRPDQVAILYKGERITYAEFAARIDSMAAFLAAAGIGVGDVVAVVMKNSAAYLEIAFAVSHVGAVLLPINYRLAAPEIAYIADNASAKLTFVDDEFAELAPPTKVIFVDAASQSDSGRLPGSRGPTPPQAYR